MAITKIGTPELFDFSATNTALQLPTGDTASRPSAPSAGQWRFNSEKKYVEYWDGGSPGAWRQIDTEVLPNPDDFPSQNFNVSTYFGTDASHKIDAKFNEAANFNGTSSRITSAPISGLSNASVSLWLKSSNSSSSESRGIIELNGDTSSNGYAGTLSVLYTYSNGEILVRSGNASSSETNILTHTDTSLRNGNWNNLVVTRDESAGVTTLYINGSEVDQETVASTSTVGGGTFIGDRATGSAGNYNWDGAIDQVRIFNTALSLAQAEDCYTDETTTTAATLNFPAGAGCVAAYQLDGDASDISGTYGGVETDIGYTGLKFQPDLVWIKRRVSGSESHALYDSIRGINKQLSSDTSAAEATNTAPFEGFTSFDTNGFTVDNNGATNRDPNSYVSWAFKGGGAPTATNSEAAGNTPTPDSVLIDGVSSTAALAGATPATNISANTGAGFSIVKYTGPASNSTIAHGLGVAPSMIIQKPTGSGSWYVYFAPGVIDATSNYYYMVLNSDGTKGTTSSAAPTTTTFNVAGSGAHIAYCFADIPGYQKVGSYTGTNSTSGPIVYTTDDGTATGTGGFEPAFLLIKGTQSTTQWLMIDNKRSTSNPRNKALFANLADAEGTNNSIDFFTNGFQPITTDGDSNRAENYIYLAIAADKDTSVPTLANSFSPTIYTSNSGNPLNIYIPFAPDFSWLKNRDSSSWDHLLMDTVRGFTGSNTNILSSNNTNSTFDRNSITSFNPNGISIGTYGGSNDASNSIISWNWKAGGLPTINSDGTRTSIVSANAAAGFSIVKWTGDGAAATIGHGLGGAPGLIIVKKLTGTSDWPVYSSGLTSAAYRMLLNDTGVENTTNDEWNSTDPTTVSPFVFSVGNGGNVSDNGQSFIGYCFADIAGYQKVGTYTGAVSGSTPGTVISTSVNGDSGFLPRFVMVKVIDFNNEDWHIYDSTRGGGNSTAKDLLPNKSSAETDFSTRTVNFVNNGFYWSFNNGDPAINNSPLTYIFLAIA